MKTSWSGLIGFLFLLGSPALESESAMAPLRLRLLAPAGLNLAALDSDQVELLRITQDDVSSFPRHLKQSRLSEAGASLLLDYDLQLPGRYQLLFHGQEYLFEFEGQEREVSLQMPAPGVKRLSIVNRAGDLHSSLDFLVMSPPWDRIQAKGEAALFDVPVNASRVILAQGHDGNPGVREIEVPVERLAEAGPISIEVAEIHPLDIRFEHEDADAPPIPWSDWRGNPSWSEMPDPRARNLDRFVVPAARLPRVNAITLFFEYDGALAVEAPEGLHVRRPRTQLAEVGPGRRPELEFVVLQTEKEEPR